MDTKKADLESALEALKGASITVVGDLILDKYLWGEVTRISPEAPVPVVKVQKEEYRLGGAANVVMNLSKLGAKAELCAVVGDDQEARRARLLLTEIGVGISNLVVDPSRPTSVKTRVIAGRQQIVRIDSESNLTIKTEIVQQLNAVLLKSLEETNGLIVSDYAKGVVTSDVMSNLKKLKDKKVTGVSKPVLLDPRMDGADYYQGVTVIKPNRKEAELHSGVKINNHADAVKAGHLLIEKWNSEMALITLGSLGMVLLEKGKKTGIVLETSARDVFDVSGAGDTVAAVFTAAISAGVEPVVAGNLANLAAGAVVSEVGTYAITQHRLKQEIERMFLFKD
ncbi:MAG: PfkB family carbohydrate kinase [Bdellovibrionota bacterium]